MPGLVLTVDRHLPRCPIYWKTNGRTVPCIRIHTYVYVCYVLIKLYESVRDSSDLSHISALIRSGNISRYLSLCLYRYVSSSVTSVISRDVYAVGQTSHSYQAGSLRERPSALGKLNFVSSSFAWGLSLMLLRWVIYNGLLTFYRKTTCKLWFHLNSVRVKLNFVLRFYFEWQWWWYIDTWFISVCYWCVIYDLI